MDKKLFDLVYCDFDWKEHHFLEGPIGATLEDFKELCARLLPKAGYRAALKHLDPRKKGWIGWSEVVESLIALLSEQGYQRVSLETNQIEGGIIIGIDSDDGLVDERLGFAGPLIADYNRKLEKKLQEDRKFKKFHSLRKKAVQIIK
jgi:hypothetical protein